MHSNLGYFNCQKYQKELLHFKQSSQSPLQYTHWEQFWSNPGFAFPLSFHPRCSFQLISSSWHHDESYTVLYLEREIGEGQTNLVWWGFVCKNHILFSYLTPNISVAQVLTISSFQWTETHHFNFRSVSWTLFLPSILRYYHSQVITKSIFILLSKNLKTYWMWWKNHWTYFYRYIT